MYLKSSSLRLLGHVKTWNRSAGKGFLSFETKPLWMRLKIVLVTVTDTAFVHLKLLIEDQDDVIRASGAPSETKLKVPCIA